MNDSPVTDPARIARNIRALVRWRLIFGVLMIGLPLATHALFERVARRLDALADHGAPTLAVVTGASQSLGQGSPMFLDYAYKVDGTIYTWTVAQSDAPYRIGETFPILYLPELPSFNQPSPDRGVAIVAAASNRAFAHNVELVMFLFFGISTLGCHYSLRRSRMTGQTEANDATAYRGRLIFAGLLIVPMMAFHVQDAARRGESLWPIVIGIALSSAVLGGSVFYLLRYGRANAAARSARLFKWIAPVLIGVAVLRVIALLASQP